MLNKQRAALLFEVFNCAFKVFSCRAVLFCKTVETVMLRRILRDRFQIECALVVRQRLAALAAFSVIHLLQNSALKTLKE